MRVPKTPPPRAVPKPDQLVRLFTDPEVLRIVAETNEQYRHWDRFRFYPCPEGFTTEDLWHAVELQRTVGRQALPLSFVKQGQRLIYVPTPKGHEFCSEIDKRTAGFIGGGPQSTLGDNTDRYLYGSLMEEAISSSQLEGASTTRKIAKEMLRANRKPRTPHEQMILNNYRAIMLARDLKDEPLTPKMLLDLQEVLTAGSPDIGDGIGRFRRADEDIRVVDTTTAEVIHLPPDASELEWRIKEICDFANSTSVPFVHPVVKAAVLHFAIGYAHPFVDGNGRTARAIFLWYLLKQDYWLFDFLPISRILVRAPAQYARAYMYTETDGGDATYFVHYTFRAIMAAIRGFDEYVTREDRESREAISLLEQYPGLNHRQRAIIQNALRDPSLVCTIAEHQGAHRVTYPTARTDLMELAKLGLLQATKEGKVIYFRPADKMRKKLRLPPLLISKAELEKVRPPIAVTVKTAGEPESSEPAKPAPQKPPRYGTLFEELEE